MNSWAPPIIVAAALAGCAPPLPSQAEIDAMNAQLDNRLATFGQAPAWTPEGLRAGLDLLLKNASRPVPDTTPYSWGDVPGLHRIKGAGFGDCTSTPEGVVCISRWRTQAPSGRPFAAALEAELSRRLPSWPKALAPLENPGEVLEDEPGWTWTRTRFSSPTDGRRVTIVSGERRNPETDAPEAAVLLIAQRLPS